jgi:hypothetical protein
LNWSGRKRVFPEIWVLTPLPPKLSVMFYFYIILSNSKPSFADIPYDIPFAISGMAKCSVCELVLPKIKFSKILKYNENDMAQSKKFKQLHFILINYLHYKLMQTRSAAMTKRCSSNQAITNIAINIKHI